jgi:hypothetical protein
MRKRIVDARSRTSNFAANRKFLIHTHSLIGVIQMSSRAERDRA